MSLNVSRLVNTAQAPAIQVKRAAAAPAPAVQPAPAPSRPKHKSGGLFGAFKSALGNVASGVAGAVGSVFGGVGHLLGKTGDALGAVAEGGLKGLGWLAALPFGLTSRAFSLVGLQGPARLFSKVHDGVETGFKIAGREVNGFFTGVGQAFKGMADGMKFLVQHPVMSLKGLVAMVRHPSQALAAMKVMWNEAIDGGPGHAAGYLLANLGPMFLSGGASEGSWLGRIATSSRLGSTAAGRVIAHAANTSAHVFEVTRQVARFDVVKTVDAIGRFGEPLRPVAKAGALRPVLRSLSSHAVHPIETAREVAGRAVKVKRAVPGKLGAARASLKDLRARAGVAKQVIADHAQPLSHRMVGAEKAMQKSGVTAEQARVLGKAQLAADKANLQLAKQQAAQAARALWQRDFSSFGDATSRTVDAVSDIPEIENTVNGASSAIGAVQDVLDPGGSLEDGLNRHLGRFTDTRFSPNQGFALRQALRLNQKGVYKGDKAREKHDRQHGALKSLSPI